MTHIEFETHFAEQAEKFGIANVIRESGEDYAFQSFMLAMSGIVARNEQKSLDEEKLDKLVMDNTPARVPPCFNYRMTFQKGYKAGYKQGWEDKK